MAGDYRAQIDGVKNANVKYRKKPDEWFVFHCNGGDNGDIVYHAHCKNGCVEGPDDFDDSC